MFNNVFDGPGVDLFPMMEARERRKTRQERLFNQAPTATLLSISLNIPGPIKQSKLLTDFAHKHTQALLSQIPWTILAKDEENPTTGWSGLYLVDGPAKDLKILTLAYEESFLAGRILDLDVLQLEEGQVHSLSRQDLGYRPRTCLICQEDAKACGRSRRHGLDQLQEVISQRIIEDLNQNK